MPSVSDLQRSRRFWTVLASGLILGLFMLRVVSLDIVRPMVLFDEVAHIDYAVHLSEGTVPTWGTVLTDRTLALASCIGNRDVNPDCVLAVGETKVTSEEFSYEAGQPPLGYLATAFTARYVISGSAFHYQQILLLRLANLATFTLLAVALAFTLSFFTRSFLTVAAVSGLLIANPWFFGAFTYVTNDSAAVTVAVILIGGYTAWLKRMHSPASRPTLWLAVVGFFVLGSVAGLVKVTSVFPLIAIAVGLVMHAVVNKNLAGSWLKLLPATFAMFGFLVAQLTFTLLRNSSAIVSERDVISNLLAPSFKPLPEVAVTRLKDLQALILGQSVFEGTVAPTYVTPGLIALGLVACFLIIWTLASPGSKFASWVPLTPQVLITSTLLISVLVLIAVPFYTYIQGPFEAAFAGRFLVPLLPLYALAVIPLVERRPWLRWPLITVTTVVLVFFSVPESELFRNIRL